MNDRDRPRGEAFPSVLHYWRTKTAESFDERARAEVAAFVACISATMPEWRAAIRGDAAAAVDLVVGQRIPERNGLRIDLSRRCCWPAPTSTPPQRWCYRTRPRACRRRLPRLTGGAL